MAFRSSQLSKKNSYLSFYIEADWKALYYQKLTTLFKEKSLALLSSSVADVASHEAKIKK